MKEFPPQDFSFSLPSYLHLICVLSTAGLFCENTASVSSVKPKAEWLPFEGNYKINENESRKGTGRDLHDGES